MVTFLGEGKLRLDPFKPVYIGECDHCGECVAICPRDAISLEEGGPVIEQVSCNGCGACVSVCKMGSLNLPNYSRTAIFEALKGSNLILHDADEERLKAAPHS